ncbi:MAG: hypothetical protein ACREM3_17390 [Candidatus Rokuibacteriota bacterium]
MTITLDDLTRAARLAGFHWSAADLEAIRPALERALDALAALERLGPDAPEPTTTYRIL